MSEPASSPSGNEAAPSPSEAAPSPSGNEATLSPSGRPPPATVPRGAWTFLLLVSLLGLGLVAWNTTTALLAPPLEVDLDAIFRAELAHERELYRDDVDDPGWYHDGWGETFDELEDPPSAEPPTTELPSAESPTAEALGAEPLGAAPPLGAEPLSAEPPSTESPGAEPPSAEPPSAEPLSAEPLSAEAPSAADPEVELSSQIATLRERIRERAEEERAQEDAWAAASVESEAPEWSLEELGLDDPIEADWQEPWHSIARAWLGVVVLLLMALGAGFVARRTADLRYGFAALIVGVVASVDALAQLAAQFVSVGAAHTIGEFAFRTIEHFTVLALILLALTAGRRASLLIALLVAAELSSSVGLLHTTGALAIGSHALAAVMPYAVLAYLSVAQLRAAASVRAGGPYREVTLSPQTRLAPHSLRHAAVALGAWFAAQLLACPIRAYGLIEPSDLSAYLSAADLAVAIMATMQLRECRDPRERTSRRFTAAALWLLTVGAALVTSPRRYGYAHLERPEVLLGVLALCMVFPSIVTWLPERLGY